jgi:hypothetical protein
MARHEQGLESPRRELADMLIEKVGSLFKKERGLRNKVRHG